MNAIDIERRGHVLIATIDRPDDDLNAVDGGLHHDLCTLVAGLKTEREARAVVLAARGRAFSAGGDFGWFPSLQDPQALAELREAARSLIYDLLDVEVPIVAAVGGPAVGLGASIALLCDVVYMTPDATLADPHVRVGIAAGDGGTLAWPLAVGPMLAKRYLMTGDPVDAAEAHRLGLCAAVVGQDSLFEEALAMAERLAAGAPLAIQATKRAVNAWLRHVAGISFDLALDLEVETFASADHREALAALAERRPPEFEGR